MKKKPLYSGFLIKCNNCGAEYSAGDIFIQAINISRYDDSEDYAITFDCNRCENTQRIEV